MNVRELFQIIVDRNGSDLYLRTKAKPRARIDGQIREIADEVVSRQDMVAVTNLLLANERRRKIFLENLDVDFIHQEPDVGRFRLNIFMQRGTPAIVARFVHTEIKTFKDLNLPDKLLELFCQESKGLFLTCGPAGNGKSTTIASMIDHINHTQRKHIITIEDPIEYLFKDQKCLISQRELELDVHSYPAALKHVTQQSPDIIFIGNIRDHDTMKAAITATELGTFVMTTFHTVNAVQTIIRMVNFFPPHLHDEVRMQISIILKGSLSLRLIPRKDGKGRVPAYESMVVTPTIARLIREGRTREVQNYIDEGELFGMQSFNRSLVKLVKDDLIDEKEARGFADSRDDFDLELKGVKRSFD